MSFLVTTWGPQATRSHPVVCASLGRSGADQWTAVRRNQVCGAHPFNRTAVYCPAGVCRGRVVGHRQSYACFKSAPMMHGTHAVIALCPIIHGWKRALRKYLEKPPGRSWYWWGPSWVKDSSVPVTR